MSASTERKNRAAARAAGTDKKMIANQEAEQKARKSRRKWIIGTVAVVLCIALVLILSSPMMYRVTTAESVLGKNYSPAQVKYVRSTAKSNLLGYGYENIVSYFGQETADEMLEQSMNSTIIQNAALLKYAQDEGISLNAQEKAAINDTVTRQMGYLREGAKTNGVSMSTYMSYIFGAGVNADVIRSGIQDSVLANKAYYSRFCELSFSPEELNAYYEDPADAELFHYAYYLVESGEERTVEEAQAAAEAVVMSFTDGMDEDIEPLVGLNDILAEEFPEAAATDRDAVLGNELDESLKPWLTEEGRQAGDITCLADADGDAWYVVLFLERRENTEPVVAVRHILVKAAANEEGVYTDEAKAEAKAQAEEILAAFEQGEKTEASFGALAYLYSEDNGSQASGGLYSTVKQGQMVPEFDAFCFADHQHGDTAIVYGESGAYAGYHVMYYVEKLPAREAAARDGLRDKAMSDWFSSLTEGVEPSFHWAYKLVD